MKPQKPDQEAQVTEYAEGFPAVIATVIEGLRQVVRKSMPDAEEIIYHDALGYTPSGSPWDRVVYIWPASHQVTLGFFFGSHLKDPDHLLDGEGARMRHVKVKTVQEAHDPALRKLVEAAAKDAPGSLAELHEKRRIRKGNPH